MLKKQLFGNLNFVSFSLLFILISLVSFFNPPEKGLAATPQPGDTQTITLFDGPFFNFLPLITIQNLQPSSGYVLLGWNDLGMHCYNRDFKDLAVLPPYNTLWAQVIQRGDPPQIVTSNIKVEYSFPNNTYSVGKSNFWTYAQSLFNLSGPLSENIGLTGNGLSGEMDAKGDHFSVDGIPLTEFQDSAPTSAYPYQLAEIIAKDINTGRELASLTVVAPVSTEMRCVNCHFDGNIDSISTGGIETNILTLHDQENAYKYPVDHTTPLMNRRPVLCAECHASNALGLSGQPGIPSLSRAMHEKHKEIVPNTQEGCYNCHPGPTTKCLRDVMSTEHNMTCIDCHGGLEVVSQNPNPWLNEPTCSQSGCHTDITQNQALYRNSTAHAGIYCAACHDSPHAIAPSNQVNDGIKFIQLQDSPGPLSKCTVCHITQPAEVDIHTTQ
ncbi:MAG: hypothetical protein CVU46_07515 [Chloroflexi bacterium HGW-Chloroflexi-8]|nr:MAG: hypothetical protein CVU46_07515 [Chloroflexi bacterium HGW-Chloroflexi-8]